jgi:hypothetical protein
VTRNPPCKNRRRLDRCSCARFIGVPHPMSIRPLTSSIYSSAQRIQCIHKLTVTNRLAPRPRACGTSQYYLPSDRGGPPPQRVKPCAWAQWQIHWRGCAHPRCEAGASRSGRKVRLGPRGSSPAAGESGRTAAVAVRWRGHGQPRCEAVVRADDLSPRGSSPPQAHRV